MRKSKLLFVILAIIFFIFLVIIALDISSRTNFPGQRKTPSQQVDSLTSEQD